MKQLKMSYTKFMRLKFHEWTTGNIPFRRNFEAVELTLTHHKREVATITMRMLDEVESSLFDGDDTTIDIQTPERLYSTVLSTSRGSDFTVHSYEPISKELSDDAINYGNRMIGFVGQLMFDEVA